MNLEKLDEAIAYIEKHPEQHDQATWFRRYTCGSTACLAGHVAILDGWTLIDGHGMAEKAGVLRHVADVAEAVLDLDDLEVDRLFYAADALADIKRYRDRIAAGELL
jgi:hypothetical protein